MVSRPPVPRLSDEDGAGKNAPSAHIRTWMCTSVAMRAPKSFPCLICSAHGSSDGNSPHAGTVDAAEQVRGQELVMVGEMPVERPAQFNLLLLYLDRRTLTLRIHGRPRSDRKRRFLLSAVAPSTSTRHPRKARPINWAQRSGPASRKEMSPDAEATFSPRIMHAC